MAGWTKAQYDEAYVFFPLRYLGGCRPGEVPVVLHYHKWPMRRVLNERWQKLQAVLQIQSTDNVCMVGAGFGWGVEELVAASGCTAVGIDVSDYIHAEKDLNELQEIRDALTAANIDPDSQRGVDIIAELYDGQPRANIIVLNEDMQTNQSRSNIRAGLNNNWPNVVIFEDIVDDAITDQEIVAANNAANLFAGAQRVIWIVTPTDARSLAAVQALTGSEVIDPSSMEHLV